MSDNEEYVEGDATSEPADTPVEDSAARAVIDSVSVSDAPVQSLKRNTARVQEARKAFAKAIVENKDKPANEDQEDPEDLQFGGKEKPAAAIPPATQAEVAQAKAAAADPVAPPAPSLDPEVRKLKEQLAAERKQLEAERAELAKKTAEPPPPDALSLEEYIDSPHRAYRNWLENMRGEKFATDDEFKSEVKDFITAMSTDVLGVPLPENVRAQFDAAQAKKIVRTHKTIQARQAALAAERAEKERAAAAERAEAERVEQEWTKAADVVSGMFAPSKDAAGKDVPSQAASTYQWLAAEDEPGKIVVDVIRAAAAKDGTQLSWQEASKKADEYLQRQYKQAYDKRQALLKPAEAPKAAPPAAKPAEAAPIAAVTPKPSAPKKWSRDSHIEQTKAAFRQAIVGKTE